MFIDNPTKDTKRNVYQACVWNTNPRAKPKSSYSKFDLIYKYVFTEFLWLVYVM